MITRNLSRGFIAFLLLLSPLFAVDQHLDCGLYWYGKDTERQKFIPGQSNAYYDPSRPTVIFFHGWQNRSSAANYHHYDLSWQHDGLSLYTQNPWVEKGWNVGIFHWEQWGDEGDVQWAEAKIWTTKGPKGMRYRLSDNSYSTALNPNPIVSVGEFAYQTIVSALSNYWGGNIRLVGHSLGNQLATRVAELIYDDIVAGKLDENIYQIQRIALLDPAWTKDGKSWLGDSNGDGHNDWVGERCRWAIFKMMDRWTQSNNFVVEIYSTSFLANQLYIAMDANLPLRERVCSVRVRPWYYGPLELPNKHEAAARHYFWTMGFNPPAECVTKSGVRYLTGMDAASASTPESRIKEMMGNGFEWDQVEGRTTENPGDDMFERKKSQSN